MWMFPSRQVQFQDCPWHNFVWIDWRCAGVERGSRPSREICQRLPASDEKLIHSCFPWHFVLWFFFCFRILYTEELGPNAVETNQPMSIFKLAKTNSARIGYLTPNTKWVEYMLSHFAECLSDLKQNPAYFFMVFHLEWFFLSWVLASRPIEIHFYSRWAASLMMVWVGIVVVVLQ